MSNMRQRASLLEQNITLKKENDELSKKLDKLAFDLNKHMIRMTKELQNLRRQPVVIIQKQENVETLPKQTKEIKSIESKPIHFIPTANTEGMKMKVSDIEKKKRKSNILCAAEKLLKIKETNNSGE